MSNWAAQGDWRLFFLYRDRLEKVTPADIKAVASKYLHRNNRTSGIFVPAEQDERVEVPEAPDVARLLEGYTGREEVAQGEAFEATPENIEKRTQRGSLASGLTYALLPKKTRGESVNVVLTLRYGNRKDLAGKNAAMSLMPSMITRGTSQLSYQELQDTLDANKATLRGSGGTGSASFRILTKRPFLPEVLGLLQQILREPTFDAKELDVLRTERLAALEQYLTDPRSLASLELRRTISPYPSERCPSRQYDR